jgi:cell division protein FtsW (lipid II flippase)
MGVLKAEPAKVRDWATRSVGASWRAYDVQLAIYALLLAGLGLAMSYSSTVVTGVSPLDPSSNFLRGLIWSVIAVVVFIVATLFDYKWLKTFV